MTREDIEKIQLAEDKYAIIDAEDYEKVSRHHWHAEKNSGSYRAKAAIKKNGRWTNILMHRLIMDAPNGTIVDHINHDTLDNRKSNLRLCTPAQSQMNRRSFKNSTSKYKGVCKYKSTSWPKCEKWLAQIRLYSEGVKKICIGYFDTEEEAALAYNAKAKELFGEYAYLNKVK